MVASILKYIIYKTVLIQSYYIAVFINILKESFIIKIKIDVQKNYL